MVNVNHPRYPEYEKKALQLADMMGKEADAVPIYDGQDGPLGDVHRKYFNKLKELQKEYAFLFTEE